MRFDIFSDPPLTVSLTSNLTSSSHAEGTYAEVKCAKADCYPENPLLVLSQENSDDLVLTNDDTLYYPMKLDRKDNLLALSCCAGSDTVWDEVCSAKQLRCKTMFWMYRQLSEIVSDYCVFILSS